MEVKFGNAVDKAIAYDSADEMVNAQDMTKEYRKHPKALKVNETDVLKALVIDKTHLDFLTENGAEKFMMLFAVREGDVGEPQDNQKFTTILVGVDNNDEIMTGEGYFRNKFMPCPSECYNYDSLFEDE